ncbi:YitT family protein [Clostridiaceae bacterium OttesenSCG-928-D20]|nr:YitT family protein [Clostridiaceae bacterium OttesenSCG-928-D20]
MKNKRLNITLAYLKLIVGSATYAAGFQFFLYDNAIPSGGVTGIAMILNYLTDLPVGALTLAFNVPLIIYALRKFGLKYVIATGVAVTVSSMLIDTFAKFTFIITSEVFLASIYGGLFTGLGLGLVLSAGGSTGGTDIVVKGLRRKLPHMNFGTIMLIMDIVIIGAFAIFFKKYDSSMYAIIAMFVTSQMIDLVLYGGSNTKLCHIITDKHDSIKNAIVERLDRGVTLLQGKGAYTGREKQILLCAIKPQQIVELRKIVAEHDYEAFVIVNDSREVFGNGFSSISDYD